MRVEGRGLHGAMRMNEWISSDGLRLRKIEDISDYYWVVVVSPKPKVSIRFRFSYGEKWFWVFKVYRP